MFIPEELGEIDRVTNEHPYSVLLKPESDNVFWLATVLHMISGMIGFTTKGKVWKPVYSEYEIMHIVPNAVYYNTVVHEVWYHKENSRFYRVEPKDYRHLVMKIVWEMQHDPDLVAIYYAVFEPAKVDSKQHAHLANLMRKM